ncbi:DUF5462 family protein [Escherichia coli]|uniref:DUF5462 family protein n=1 Tax=Escherichia coli TaxID=562 RepID=UPI0003EF1C70|nr:DUF5462 family protein [Escherichia coli]EGB2672727.1 fimbrial protein [Escherichia coli]EJA1216571.1 DUF5462 family protein [Escherichia coli]MCZ0571146.1 DUF5462 family protein [Escherichia coli]HAI7179505.1 fimbrial protein [Escherichia coli]HAW3000213.1 fimbrial protein [Escherichia coli]
MKNCITPYILTAITATNICMLSAHASSEKEFYLGVVNGQVVGNSIVKVNRTLPESVLFYTEKSTQLDQKLVIRNAESQMSSGGALWVAIKGGGEAKVTMKLSLIADGKKVPINFSQRGNDLLLEVPKSAKIIELRSDEPVGLDIPANYRGRLEIELQIEKLEGEDEL